MRPKSEGNENSHYQGLPFDHSQNIEAYLLLQNVKGRQKLAKNVNYGSSFLTPDKQDESSSSSVIYDQVSLLQVVIFSTPQLSDWKQIRE